MNVKIHCHYDKLQDADKLKPNPRNPRTHPDEEIKSLAEIIKKTGWRRSVTVSKRSGYIARGHGAVEAAKLIGCQVPVEMQSFRTEAEEHAHMIADNRVAELAGWNDEELAKLLKDIDASDLNLTGFDDADLDNLLLAVGGADGAPEAKLDEAKPLRKKWHTKTGQLWEIGEHRLLCGDSLNAGDVSRVMDGKKWDVAVIDPPFERDDLPHLSDPCIVFGQAKHLRLIPSELFRFERIIDKVKEHRGPSVHIGHRHAFVVQVGSERTCPASKATYPSIVVAENRPNHPHEKPAWLLREHLTLWTPAWKVAFDPFSGSGTTLVVCEQMRRAGRAIEQDAGYVAVALERLSEMGLKPRLAGA